MEVQTYGLTHVGRVRQDNQDCHLIKEPSPGQVLLLVADGMGGEKAGHLAAGLACQHFLQWQPRPGPLLPQMREVACRADRAVQEAARTRPRIEGLGTTLTAAVVTEGQAVWVHVGDSRLYLLRDGRLRQITRDQNLAQFLVEEGDIASDQANHHPLQNLLEQSLGDGECEPDTGSLATQSRDLLLLCSDGLYTELDEETIGRLLAGRQPLAAKLEALLAAALEAGGRDNITLVAAQL